MSAKALRKRVERIEQRAQPEEHDNLFTWEEFCRVYELLRRSPEEFSENGKARRR